MNVPDLSVLDPETRAALTAKLAREAWSRGLLSYKLHATQKKIMEAIDASPRRQFFVLCSRRLGKSYAMLCKAFSYAIQHPGARILYLAPTARDAEAIVTDLAEEILRDCPNDLKPVFHATHKTFTFTRNGQAASIIRLRGVNSESYNNLRGTAANLIICDEASLFDELRPIINSVCLPMTMTTGGRIILATTPPVFPGHFSSDLYHRLANDGAAIKFTLLHAPHLTDEVKGEYLVEVGEDPLDVPKILSGEMEAKTDTALREFFVEFTVDANKSAVPEYTQAVRKAIRIEVPRPEFYTPYVSMDLGAVDLSAILYGWWDFLNQRLVIEDETLLTNPNTPTIATDIKTKSAKLWGYVEPIGILDSAGDGGLRLASDLKSMYGLKFRQTKRHDKMAHWAQLRAMIQAKRIIIHPKCVHLDRQLSHVTWNATGSDLQRGDPKIEGHFDSVSALLYLVRNLQKSLNPYPDHFFQTGGKLGPAVGTYQTRHKGNSKKAFSLRADTPLAKRLEKAKK